MGGIILKNRLKSISLFSLCIFLMVLLLPFSASASDELDNKLRFSSFEQLQHLADGTYREPVWLTYTGEAPLVIAEDLTLPANLNVDVRGSSVTIPEAVSLTADPSCCLYADSLQVAGTMTCSYLSVTDTLTVDGTLNNNNVLYLSRFTLVTGASRIIPGQKWSTVSCTCPVETMDDLKAVLAMASSPADDTWRYLLTFRKDGLHISESLVIPENCELYMDPDAASSGLTVDKNCILELNCRTWLYSPLELRGVLVNRGDLNIHAQDGGSIRFGKDGYLLSEGSITVYSKVSVPLISIIDDIDLDAYSVNTLKKPVYRRILTQNCPHKMQDFDVTVTAPSCSTGGYTTHTCPDCGSSFVSRRTDPTGQHTYAGPDDPDCDVCGAERDIAVPVFHLYRLYNPYTLEHLFTSNTQERDHLDHIGWNYEGIAWDVPDSGIPVYRLYNPYDDSHFYTISSQEIETLTPLGWQLDGVMCYSTTEDSGKPVYRLFNPYEPRNYHLYTISTEECAMLVPLGWVLEGIAWYGIQE